MSDKLLHWITMRVIPSERCDEKKTIEVWHPYTSCTWTIKSVHNKLQNMPEVAFWFSIMWAVSGVDIIQGFPICYGSETIAAYWEVLFSNYHKNCFYCSKCIKISVCTKTPTMYRVHANLKSKSWLHVQLT